MTRKQLTFWPDYVQNSGRNLENAQLKRRQKWSHEKSKLDNARKLRGIYFIDPEDKELNQRDHQECSQEMGNTSDSRYALQDEQEQSELWDSW